MKKHLAYVIIGVMIILLSLLLYKYIYLAHIFSLCGGLIIGINISKYINHEQDSKDITSTF